jgi:hypothetical protein
LPAEIPPECWSIGKCDSAPPELVDCGECAGTCDVWSLGMTVLNLTLDSISKGLTEDSSRRQIDCEGSRYSGAFRQLIKRMLNEDPTRTNHR